ncbi:hypothetical protein [Teredinibacter turnerae]|uniref:hypothetical protein n=1 Tax=Teredinibacter turnerae TaxID=2426 RepID=UPI0003716656|nr:hypothetical protein [Teredinibacter turnerae]
MTELAKRGGHRLRGLQEGVKLAVLVKEEAIMQASHQLAEDRYESLREYARNIALESMPNYMSNSRGQPIDIGKSVQLRSIDIQSKAKAKQWETSPYRRVDWSWPGGASEYAWRHPKRFEVAIWYRNLFLCGLGLGRPTWSGNKLRLDFLEASPKTTPLTGLVSLIAVGAAEAYADAIGAVQLRIMSPINSKVKDHYLNSLNGYSYNARGNYCYRDLA